jgi:hypothetical protein
VLFALIGVFPLLPVALFLPFPLFDFCDTQSID